MPRITKRRRKLISNEEPEEENIDTLETLDNFETISEEVWKHILYVQALKLAQKRKSSDYIC
jgi:hypothetical protein